MIFLKIILGSICATTIMTVFSYIYEEMNKGMFKEPQLLNFLVRNSSLSFFPRRSHILGWGLHYSIGLVFAIGFELLLFYQIINFSVGRALIFGFVIGIIGIIGWNIMFRLSKKPEAFNSIPFYRHILIAHLLFGVILGLFYKLWNIYII
ncbi:hypothetical protein [Haloflavibacter putidus]|uniref:DUF2938 family protein n=1 Tax=Haloflavibacter putidus TaxID=2576776 RepID=A0A507ZUI1_9FLAO|nr:hypothetical protein [Haloflavibacter putidus]TQD39408.1 hypothetical protein FKR84_05790 [Haloflavibacter putidus]